VRAGRPAADATALIGTVGARPRGYDLAMPIRIEATVVNREGSHEVDLATNGNAHAITVPPRTGGRGSGANGGELLFAALATCYGNDIYREAARREIEVVGVHVHVSGTFGEAPGSVAEDVTYRATVEARASREAIEDLMRHTDTVAEIQNTLRLGLPVTLSEIRAIPV
jgi:uncharacterized OsmC-like protein